MNRFTYKHTLLACYMGYITQAVIVNLAPLLFLTFRREFGLSLGQIGLLTTLNFCVQMGVDYISARIVDKVSQRLLVLIGCACCTAGLVCLALLPGIMLPYAGICIATVLYAIGGGIIEVLISPLVEALPGEEKASAMSLLHSFYCWGHVGVVLLSTLFFVVCGTGRWPLLALLWALVPLATTVLFFFVPLNRFGEEGEVQPARTLFRSGLFWLLFVLMLCAGASEQAMSQWTSLFAEAGLGVSKTVGDLLGPCAFAALMGLTRLLYGKFGHKLNLYKGLSLSAIGCVCSYLITVFAPWPLVSLIGCALCGACVGLMWPGTLSLSAERLPQGGSAMFAYLALAGDVGCASGPGLVGLLSGLAETSGFGLTGANQGLKVGLLAAIVFPLVLALGVFLLKKRKA